MATTGPIQHPPQHQHQQYPQQQQEEFPPMFACKKWAIVALALVSIVIQILVVVFSGAIVSILLDKVGGNIDKDADQVFLVILIVLAVFGILVELIGLIGAVNESLCMSITFLVLSLLSFLSVLCSVYSLVILLPQCIISALFIRDLNRIQKHRSTGGGGGVGFARF